MVRSVALPKGISYSSSGAKIPNMIAYTPAIIECHLSARVVTDHCGVNDLNYLQFANLRVDYVILAN